MTPPPPTPTDAAARATAQLLHRPPGDPVAIVRHQLGVQAQDRHAFPLALRARGTDFAASDVEAALERGDLVVASLMRGTLHLVAAEDHGWLLALTGPTLRRTSERRLRQLDVTPERAERAVATIAAALPSTRDDLKALLGSEGQQTAHLLLRAQLERACVFGAGRTVVAAPPSGPAGDLGARYLASRTPATPKDLAAWAGISLGAAREAWVDVDPPDPVPHPPRLLPRFDEYVMSWKDHRIPMQGGMVPQVAVREGRIERTWKTPPAGYEDEAADIQRFLSG